MNLNVLKPYVKDLKPTADEFYVYTAKDEFFGGVIFSMNSMAINMIQMSDISEDYFNKIYSLNCINKGFDGFLNWFGVVDSPTYTSQYVARYTQNKAMYTLKQFEKEMKLASYIDKKCMINEDPDFYNNILIRKSDEGAGRYVYKNEYKGDRALYLAPCMLPCSKSTPLDCVIYYIDGLNYNVVSFTSHKKTNTVVTLFRTLKV